MGLLIRPWNLSLLLLGLTALVAISPVGHVIATLAAISVIGLPIALIIAAIPSFFLVLVALRLAVGAWQGLRERRAAIGVACAIGLLAMGDFFIFRAWRVNAWLDAMAAGLVAGDRDALAAPTPVETLAIVHHTWSGRAQNDACDDLCRRLLLSGAVRTVVIVTVAPKTRPRGTSGVGLATEWPEFVPTAEQPAMAWRLEARPSCQDPGLSRQGSPLALPASVRGQAPAIPTDELMRLSMAQGTCLIGEATTLAAADAVLAYGPLRLGQSSFSGRSNAWVDTVSAWRIAYWQKRGLTFAEPFRRTGVAYERLPGMFIPTIIGGSQLQTVNGWVKTSVQLNRGRHESDPPIGEFIVTRLGLNLQPSARHETLPQGEAGAEGRPTLGVRPEQAEVVDRMLRDSTGPSAIDAQVLADYLDGLRRPMATRQQGLDRADVQRIIQIAETGRIQLPAQFRWAAALAVKLDPSVAPVLAAALVTRLEALPPLTPQDNAETGPRAQLGTITGSLAELPGAVLEPHRPQILAIMRNREARKPALALLRRLDGLGSSLTPEIFAMMDDAVILRDARGRGFDHLSRDWSAVWNAGAVSICRMASGLPASALEQLRTRATSLAAKGLRSADVVVAAAMLRMGASDADVMATLRIDPADPKAARNFESTLRRARRGEPCQ